MSPKIPVTQHCAAPCRRLEIVASRRAAAIWSLWSCSVCLVVWFAVALPWPMRAAFCLATLTFNTQAIRRVVLLRGRRAVCALEWRDQGGFTVWLGAARIAESAVLAAGSFRLGGIVLLRFEATAGMRVVLIDGGIQDRRAFRRLCRRLGHVRRSAGTAGPAVPGSRTDTIGPKV